MRVYYCTISVSHFLSVQIKMTGFFFHSVAMVTFLTRHNVLNGAKQYSELLSLYNNGSKIGSL